MIELEGKTLAKQIKSDIAKEVAELKTKYGKVPGLGLVMVGNNAASQIYSASKTKSCVSVGMQTFNTILPDNATDDEVINAIKAYNDSDEVDGIIVQLPLPAHISSDKILEAIDKDKDVDGFKPENLGLLLIGYKNSLKSCTPSAVMEILSHYNIDIEGKDVTLIGRSNIVGKPMAGYIINAGGTITICNTHTKNIGEKTRRADILITSMGVPKFVKRDMVKEGAVVIDIGINKTPDGICGDVDYDDVKDKVAAITPVPGGVGAMTVAMLLRNTLQAFKNNKNIE